MNMCKHSKVSALGRSRLAGALGMAILAAGLLAASGCSSSRSASKLVVGAVTFTDVNGVAAAMPRQVITQGESTYLDIALADDPQNLGVNWSVFCGSAPPPGTPLPPGQTEDQSCGTFAPAHTMSGPIPSFASSGAGYVALYTAPPAVPKQGVVTLYASATSDPSRTSSVTLTVLGQYISIQFAPAPPAMVAPGASTQITAVVNNDPTNAGVSWSTICAGTDCGSFSQTATASGVATTYTAPANPGAFPVQILAGSAADPTRVVAAVVSLPSGS